MDIDSLLFYGILVLVFIGIPIGIGLLLYFTPKKLGYPKVAKYLVIGYTVFVSIVVLKTIFEDEFFSKNNAKELVEKQEIKLKDDFDLLENKSISGIGDYYHMFALKISAQDKLNAIAEIINSENFTSNIDSIDTFINLRRSNKYFGKKVIQNYETDQAFIREYFETSGKEGYSPTFRRISINKIYSKLTFEDIEE